MSVVRVGCRTVERLTRVETRRLPQRSPCRRMGSTSSTARGYEVSDVIQ